jgi:hypothetical protein
LVADAGTGNSITLAGRVDVLIDLQDSARTAALLTFIYFRVGVRELPGCRPADFVATLTEAGEDFREHLWRTPGHAAPTDYG